MKKILLLISILTYCLSAKSQSFTSATGTDGTTITITATGETPSCYFSSPPSFNPTATTTSSPGTDLSNYVNVTVSSSTSYNPVTQQPTSMKLTLKNAFNQPITATFYFYVNTYCNGSFQLQNLVPVTIIINPKPVIITYYSVAKSTTLPKNNCSAGYVASKVTYSVPAGKYMSTISQADADQKAASDISANAQNYANANGICTPAIYVRAEYIREGTTVTDHVGVNQATGMPYVDGSTTEISGHVNLVAYKDAACTQLLMLSSPLTVAVINSSTHGPTGTNTYTIPAGQSSTYGGGGDLEVDVVIQDSYDDNFFFWDVAGYNNSYVAVASLRVY